MILALMLGTTVAKVTAQNRDSIYYNLPDFVITKALKYLKTEKKDKDIGYYIYLNINRDTTYVMVSGYNFNLKELVFLLKNTNRYLKLNPTLTLPIIFAQDERFSDVLHHVIKPKQKGLYTKIEHTDINPAGYWVSFTGRYSNAVFLKEELYSY